MKLRAERKKKNARVATLSRRYTVRLGARCAGNLYAFTYGCPCGQK